MKAVLTLICLLTPFFTNAAAQVNYLNVVGDTVHFSTNEEKALTSPACAVAETNDKFAVSLLTESGRAIYSLLITALASKQAINVKSALDCVGVGDLERAQGVSITPVTMPGGKSLYLYTADRLEKLGRVVKALDYRTFMYLAKEDDTQLATYSRTSYNNSVYFTEPNCAGQGYAMLGGRKVFNANYHPTESYITESKSQTVTFQSWLRGDVCEAYDRTGNYYKLVPNDDICRGTCVLIEE